MSTIIAALREHAEKTPLRIAVQDKQFALTYAQLLSTVEQLAARLEASSPRVIGLLADNSTDWVLADLAAKDVALLRADWTLRDPAITAALAALGRSGVPLYVLYTGNAAPRILSEILSASELRAALSAVPLASSPTVQRPPTLRPATAP